MLPALPAPSRRLRGVGARLLHQRHGGILIFAGVFAGIALLTRLGLLARAAGDAAWDASMVAAFAWGLVFDLAATAFAALPLVFILAVLPGDWGTKAWHRVLTHVTGGLVIAALIFGALAEATFWAEFGTRFNFIAVDYLVYTTEVIGNIRESYNLVLVGAVVAAGTAVGGWGLLATGLPARWLAHAAEPARRRWIAAGLWSAALLAVGLAVNQDQLPAFRNNYNRELAKDGLWSLFAAFRANEIEYDQFYRTRPERAVFERLHHELSEDGSSVPRTGEPDTLRYVSNDGPMLRPNVIQITVESLSADFLGSFNQASPLTPNLDAIAGRSLVFENFYATGTRTDRGMEALTLSIPPTPGRSIIKRPRNAGLFTLGSVFRAEGYDTAFLYGGYGYFDNMNAFFGGNGYRVVDRNSVDHADITFANAWGACDEDLLRWTLREADAGAATGRPFHYFVMTTSNHRPFTFPDGRIDLPSKAAGRAGAVKYTDFAIGQFLREAATRPWFKNTVFVIVADHCASSAGKTELPVQNYHIPLIVYAPGGQIAPGRIKTLTSQMDYAPTLLGLLNWSYPSRFFGHDVRKIAPGDAHALIGSYQKLGHLEKSELEVLGPLHDARTYRYEAATGALVPIAPSAYAEEEAISFYQTASWLYRNGRYREVTPEERAWLIAQESPRTSAVVRPGVLFQ
jgi:phosphoglycerol transferase MdoB-like AlkP superfamily enzyme